MKKKKYIVMIDDNFHFMDVGERYNSGEYDTYSEAVKRCESIVDEFLDSAFEPRITAKSLYSSYTMYGEDPFIIGESDEHFSAWNYAEKRASEIINERNKSSP